MAQGEEGADTVVVAERIMADSEGVAVVVDVESMYVFFLLQYHEVSLLSKEAS